MTKDEMRALLATAVPAAIAEGKAYVVRRKSGKHVRDIPDTEIKPQFKAAVPRRYLPRMGVTGAGFKVPSYDRYAPTAMPYLKTKAEHIHVASEDAPVRLVPYLCPVCEQSGKNCTC